jgi:hypothetical protein
MTYEAGPAAAGFSEPFPKEFPLIALLQPAGFNV